MKRAAAETSIPIAQHVEAHRQSLFRERERLPEMQATRQRLHDARATCTHRRTLRRATDIDAALVKLDAAIERLESNGHLREFERHVVPYMEAYVRNSGVPALKAPRFVVPGEAAPASADDAGATQTQSDVVAEYLSVVQGGMPRPTIERSVDSCPRCPNSEMVLVPAKAILVCPRCGRSATFLDSTLSSISYDENVEMVTFSYKRGNHFQVPPTRIEPTSPPHPTWSPLLTKATGFPPVPLVVAHRIGCRTRRGSRRTR